MTFLWLIGLLLFIYMEANTISLVSIWFAIGALAAMIASALGAEFWLQITLFFGVSGILLACLRPVFRKFIKPRVVASNVDAIIGTTGYVIADIDNLAAHGQVKLGAMEWSARSTSGSDIAAGTLVKVDRIEGVKVFVSVVEKETAKHMEEVK